MRADYRAAKKLGEDAVREAEKNNVSPYLPILDTSTEIKRAAGEVHLGLQELPLSRIIGNKEAGRNNSFANNFMPLFDETSEFGLKWSALYDSYKTEGIRDAIKVYEYMHNYYVQEGNKRVSVSKYGGSEYILADVTRILPGKSDRKEVRAYYEFLDFYRVTGNFYIVLTEPGEYGKLAELLGQNLNDVWDEQDKKDLKSAYFIFERKYRSVLKINDKYTVGEAFLIYISIFAMKTLFSDTDEQIVKNIRMARNELLASNDIDDIVFIDNAPKEEARPTGLMGLFSGIRTYSALSPLKVAFIYNDEPDNSRWIDSHEAGRLYLDEMTGSDVRTQSYIAEKSAEGFAAAIEKAVKDRNEIIFTVSRRMMPEAVKAAVKHPDIKFLNCSIGNTSSMVRCYHGKLYEASFLMGVLAGQTLLLECNKDDERRIGYLVRDFGNMSMANINAFAIGVSMIDPECKIETVYRGRTKEYDYQTEWKNEGVKIFADFDYSSAGTTANRPGLYKTGNGKNIYLGAPYYNWGRYYLQIVMSVLYGSWRLHQIIDKQTAANYWFGLSTGVVDIRVGDLPYQTRKMLALFKSAVISGSFEPFKGEIHSQSGIIQEDPNPNKHIISLAQDVIPAGKIASMTWMNDNVE
ncbi:MAG: BMP family ABC transporter substrate-binding protein [Ruminiclostridium sp.]|nr:BMP family ABC transporter substrate-binding protein [Ruminiclostridium sp.]